MRLFTARHGLLGAVVKGVYRKDKKAANLRAALQLGNTLELTWFGKGGLKTLTQVDVSQRFPSVDNTNFLCLCYINELLMRFLHEGESVADIHLSYQKLLFALGTLLESRELLEPFLRKFEFELLDSLGYGIDFSLDVLSDAPVCCGASYRVTAGVGVQRQSLRDEFSFSGDHLLSIQRREFDDPSCLMDAKRISRYLLNHYLDGKPLKTRQLYRDMHR